MSNTSRTADVIVVGAGVIGSSAALELARRGLEVIVVDRAGGPGHGSTSASSAVIRFNYSTWDGVATAWESKHCWANWSDHLGCDDEAGLATLNVTGIVMLDSPVAPQERITPIFDRVGVPYERWDAATLRQHIPGIDTGKYWPPKPVDSDEFFAEATEELGALFSPDAGFIDDPQLATHNLATAAQLNGVRFLFHQTVVKVLRHRGRASGVVLADGVRLLAPVIVNAAGPWSGAFNKLAGVGGEFTVGVRPMRQEVHQVPAPPAYSMEGRWGYAVADMDLGTYFRPAPGGMLYIGGTEPECDEIEWLDDPDEASLLATAERFEAQVTRVARRLPELSVPNRVAGIAGVYDVASDWTPIYDRTDLDGFYVAIGTSGNQFKNAPLAGRFIATLVEAIEAGHDHDGDPLRYRGHHTGHEINLGAYSRKRPFNAASSGTVMG